MRRVKKIPTEEETEEQAELFSDMMQTIVNEWDPYINNLKKSLPLNPDEIKEVQKKKDEIFTELDYIFCLDKSSPIIALILKLGRKLRYDHNFFRYYDRDHGIQPARAEQYTTAIILADLEASKNPHPEEAMMTAKMKLTSSMHNTSPTLKLPMSSIMKWTRMTMSSSMLTSGPKG